MNTMAGQFMYGEPLQADSLIVDPAQEPNDNTQDELRSEISDFEDVMAIDYKYCMTIEGVSQESNLWVARNQHETGLADVDLQKFKNVAWNECVVRKFLTSKEGDVELVGKSMINIIQSLNLQWKNLQVMGLHSKVESAEKQVVMACMENELITFDLDVGRVARSLRRCEHFSDFFANAVGGQIVANSGRTPGLYKTKIGSDWDYTYKNKTLYHLERALERKKFIVEKCLKESDHVDYVQRLTQLKIIRPDSSVELSESSTGQGPPGPPPSGGGGYIEPNFSGIERRLEKIIKDLMPKDVNAQIKALQDAMLKIGTDPAVIATKLKDAVQLSLDPWYTAVKADQQALVDEMKKMKSDIQTAFSQLDLSAELLKLDKLFTDKMDEMEASMQTYSTQSRRTVNLLENMNLSDKLHNFAVQFQYTQDAFMIIMNNLRDISQYVAAGGGGALPPLQPIPPMPAMVPMAAHDTSAPQAASDPPDLLGPAPKKVRAGTYTYPTDQNRRSGFTEQEFSRLLG